MKSASADGSRRARGRLLLGLAGLVAFLTVLEVVFWRELSDGRATLSETRRALESYGTSSLTRALSDELELAALRAAEVEADPLHDARGLLLVRDGVLELPRVAGAESRGVERLTLSPWGDGQGRGESPAGPYAERLALLRAASRALDAQDSGAFEKAVRESLEHRLLYVLPPEEDLSAAVALLRLVTRTGRASPELMRRVLRDGLELKGTKQEGLQRQVLRAWGRLGAEDVRFLCAEVAGLSRGAAVPAEDFGRECGRAEGRPALPEGEGVFVRFSSDGAVVRVRGEEVVGLTLDVPRQLGGLERDMRERGLLRASDTLTLSSIGGEGRGEGKSGWRALSSLRLELTSPRFLEAEAALTSRFTLKTLLALVTLLLGVGVVAVTAWAQSRRARYLALQSDFVSTVSHELRTPLASMRVMAETLERKLEGQGVAKDYPARLVQTVDGLSFLVENILSFNRLEKGGWVLKRGAVKLSSLQAVLEEDAAHAPVAVEQAFTGFSGVEVSADSELLRIFFLNLLRNAWKYNERAPVTLKWEAATSGDALTIRVTDNGVGIPREAWETVFEAFHRLRDGRGRGGGGSGLGLSLCRRIAELHGGTLHLTASTPEGTTFTLTLP
ncbi:MAG: HAMP domain-containing histidine kinase, partial [Myxococcales bacterium]|nr:HAMP domain-containing histidine kinase [Myxococcales bacterium]